MSPSQTVQVNPHIRAEEAGGHEPLHSVAEAAALLGVNPSTIWRWIDAGKLPAVRVGTKNIRVRARDLFTVVRPAREPRQAAPLVSRANLNFAPPSPDELARRKALFQEIVELRARSVISPLTSADLVHRVRNQEKRAYGKPRA